MTLKCRKNEKPRAMAPVMAVVTRRKEIAGTAETRGTREARGEVGTLVKIMMRQRLAKTKISFAYGHGDDVDDDDDHGFAAAVGDNDNDDDNATQTPIRMQILQVSPMLLLLISNAAASAGLNGCSFDDNITTTTSRAKACARYWRRRLIGGDAPVSHNKTSGSRHSWYSTIATKRITVRLLSCRPY